MAVSTEIEDEEIIFLGSRYGLLNLRNEVFFGSRWTCEEADLL